MLPGGALALLAGVLLSIATLAADVGSGDPRPAVVELHVQQRRDDRAGYSHGPADGSAARPYGSIHEARDRVRQLRRDGPADELSVKVSVGAGRFPPLSLLPEDSGTPGHPVVYEGRADGSSLISGGIEVPPSAFSPRPGHQPHHLQADVSALGLAYGNLSGGECTLFPGPAKTRSSTVSAPLDLAMGGRVMHVEAPYYTSSVISIQNIIRRF
jgi:hypothetical protein